MQRLSVNGTRISFVDAGNGVPLLLLHGLGGSHDDWRMQIPGFAAKYRVIVPDLRGFGVSERREPFTIQQHARDMMALLSALSIERAHVVGLSMGGAVAATAVRSPGCHSQPTMDPASRIESPCHAVFRASPGASRSARSARSPWRRGGSAMGGSRSSGRSRQPAT